MRKSDKNVGVKSLHKEPLSPISLEIIRKSVSIGKPISPLSLVCDCPVTVIQSSLSIAFVILILSNVLKFVLKKILPFSMFLTTLELAYVCPLRILQFPLSFE